MDLRADSGDRSDQKSRRAVVAACSGLSSNQREPESVLGSRFAELTFSVVVTGRHQGNNVLNYLTRCF